MKENPAFNPLDVLSFEADAKRRMFIVFEAKQLKEEQKQLRREGVTATRSSHKALAEGSIPSPVTKWQMWRGKFGLGTDGIGAVS